MHMLLDHILTWVLNIPEPVPILNPGEVSWAVDENLGAQKRKIHNVRRKRTRKKAQKNANEIGAHWIATNMGLD